MIVGIKEKSVLVLEPVVPVHATFLNEKIVFFGPVHGKSPQSALFAHANEGSKK